MNSIRKSIVRRLSQTMEYQDIIDQPLFPNSKRPRIQATLHINNPENKDIYKLLIFAPRDLPSHTQFNQTLQVKNDNPFVFEMCLKRSPYLPEHICIWLFVEQIDQDDLETQIVLGCGKTKIDALLNKDNEISLIDSGDASVQATLKLCVEQTDPQQKACLIDLLKHPITREHQIVAKLIPLAKQYIEEVKQSYVSFEPDNDSYFYKVVSPMGDLPLLSWTLLATQIHARNNNAQAYLSHLLDISLDRLGLTLEDVTPKKPYLSDILAEMVLWQERAKVYSYDTSRTSNHQHIGSDQWTRLGCMPDQKIATGDCEDFAESMLETLYQFKKTIISPESVELLIIQKHLKHYTSCLTIGQLKSDSGYVAHAYVTLLDQRWLQHQVKFDKSRNPKFFETNFQSFKREALYPPIFLEGTAYTQSTWSKQNLKHNSNDIRVYSNSQLIFNTQECSSDAAKWERIFRFKIPASSIRSSSKYGKIFSLLTADLYALELKEYNAVHLLCSSSDEPDEIGLDQQLLAMYSSKCMMTCALRWRTKEIQEMLHLLRDMPNTTMANAPHITQDSMVYYQKSLCFNSKNIKMAEFDIRQVDFIRFEDQITQAIDELRIQLGSLDMTLNVSRRNIIDEIYVSRQQTIPISSDLDIMNITLWKNCF